MSGLLPKLTWKYIENGAAGADLPIAPNDRTRFTDPSLSLYRHPDGEWTATLYLNDGLTFVSWEKTDLKGCLEEIRDNIRSIQFTFNNSL